MHACMTAVVKAAFYDIFGENVTFMHHISLSLPILPPLTDPMRCSSDVTWLFPIHLSPSVIHGFLLLEIILARGRYALVCVQFILC